MEDSFFIVVSEAWLTTQVPNPKRIAQQHLCPIGDAIAHLDGKDCALLVKYRGADGKLIVDDGARFEQLGDAFYVKSKGLAEHLLATSKDGWVTFYFDGPANDARCVVSRLDSGALSELSREVPELRLEAFDLPPATTTVVTAADIRSTLHRRGASRDPELFGLHASRFLDTPHIITALFTHLLSTRTEDNIRFPVKVRKVAEQLRAVLLARKEEPRIVPLQKSHVDLWAEVEKQRFAFVDGGVARIPAFAGVEPMAMRVGVYSVRPGVATEDDREHWRMTPFVLGDLVDTNRPTRERFESRRFLEAARYTFEPLTAINHVRAFPDTAALLLHGPLINQFTQYDEGEPNYIPFVAPDVLARHGIDRASVAARLQNLPQDDRGEDCWNQFMALYGYVMLEIAASAVPVAGVVERPTGRAVANALVRRLADMNEFTEEYVRRTRQIFERYDITDDFLFGCVLREGEYVTPIEIAKNPPHKARGRWEPVVRQYPSVRTMLMKSDDAKFPFRVELNASGAVKHEFLARFIYHTARLLPRYAFPVGLDIVDKYAKVPDWIAKGVSRELSAMVMRRALRQGDANFVAQVRQLLSGSPRDFFLRPTSGRF